MSRLVVQPILQEEFEVERTEIINTHVRQRKDMTDIIAAMEQEFADMDNELRQVSGGEMGPERGVVWRHQNMVLLNVQLHILH
eukprot:1157788-Pelagomonas_calceolata.AAC.5